MKYTRLSPRRTSLRALVSLAALCALACDDTSSGSSDPRVREASPPIALTDGLVYTPTAAPSGADVVTLDLTVDPPRAVPRALETPVAARAQRGEIGDAVLLTAGAEARDEGKRRVPAVPSQLVVVGRTGELVARTLSGRYGALTLSTDGRFALAHTPTGSLVLQNAIEVVDLDAPPTQPGKVVTLQLDGRAPSGFVFSPKDGFSRRMVVILFAGSVMLLDLERPENGPIAVPLATSGDGRGLIPQRVLFAGERMFVQSSGTSSVLVLELLAAADQRHGFRVVPSLLGASAGLRDVALVGSGASLRIAALTGQLELLDPQSGSSTVIAATPSATTLLPFEGTAPGDPVSAPRALVFAFGVSSVGFVELGGGEGWTGRNVETVELGEPVIAMLPLLAHKRALGLHASSRLSVIDLQARTVDPYRLAGPLADWLIDDDATRTRLWVASGDKLGILDLAAKTATEVPITLPISPTGQVPVSFERGVAQRAVVLRLVPGARRRVALLHASEAGRVTLIDAETPTRESAREPAGFFLAGLFD
ncbi:MAG: hypothetical protein ABW252_10830 [Polyangiales bacterium]